MVGGGKRVAFRVEVEAWKGPKGEVRTGVKTLSDKLLRAGLQIPTRTRLIYHYTWP